VTNTRPARLLRNREAPGETSSLELFFDLAIIAALSLSSSRLFHGFDLVNVDQTVVLMAGSWWIWIATAWSTDWFNPDEPFIQRLVISVMFAGLILAASIPDAFGDHGIVFASAYVGIHLGRGLVLAIALRGHAAWRRTIRVLIWFGLSAIPWLVGAVLPPVPRMILWTIALVMDGGSAWFGWPVPLLGRTSDELLRVVGDHLSERYRQVFVIALSEVVVLSAVAYSSSGFDPVRTLAFALSFVNAGLLLWIYLARPGRRLGTVIDERPPRVAVTAAYCHGVMVTGTIFTAVGDEVLIRHPLGAHRMSSTFLVVGGTAVFLGGRVLVDILVNGRLSWPRLAGFLVALAIVPVALSMPPLVMAALANLVLVGIVVWHTLTDRSPRSTAILDSPL
jgi:low temperature requirement protein LtrA